MDTKKYHEICNKPSTFSRPELEQTLIALEKAGSNIKGLVADALKSKPVEKPTQHQGGEETEWEYLSPEFVAEDMQRLKQFGRMAVDSDNDLEITFYADGQKVWEHTLTGSGHRRQFISPKVQGRKVQVRIKSKGAFRGARYEFVTRRL